jgi:hypothetical protein
VFKDSIWWAEEEIFWICMGSEHTPNKHSTANKHRSPWPSSGFLVQLALDWTHVSFIAIDRTTDSIFILCPWPFFAFILPAPAVSFYYFCWRLESVLVPYRSAARVCVSTMHVTHTLLLHAQASPPPWSASSNADGRGPETSSVISSIHNPSIGLMACLSHAHSCMLHIHVRT